MVVKNIHIEKFRAFNDVSFNLGRRLTAIVGRNGTQKTTVLGMIGQPFSISNRTNALFGCSTIDGHNFRSQFSDKFKFSPKEKAGEHIWTLFFNNNIISQLGLDKSYYKTKSIYRSKQSESIRLWNAEGNRQKGSGYIQLPVYFLSLARLYPIGEAGTTKRLDVTLTEEETNLFYDWYSEVLNIPQRDGDFAVGVEQQTVRLRYAGVSRNGYDIFTNAAGEGAFSRIALAVLSFRRLKMDYPGEYKGGILLIDEIDAAFYPRAQKNLINYLHKVSTELNFQVIFTTHSPEVLAELNDLRLKEQASRKSNKSINLDKIAYDNSIVYLEPDEINIDGIIASNVNNVRELRRCLDNMNLMRTLPEAQLRVYCEDAVAISFAKQLLECNDIPWQDYLDFQDVDLGWSNYIKLLGKKAFRIQDSLIMLDADVTSKKDYENHKSFVEESDNVIFLPVEVEKGLFELLHNQERYADFFLAYKDVLEPLNFGYATCFNSWPLLPDKYKTNDFKHWFKYVDDAIGKEKLFAFWHSLNAEQSKNFAINVCKAHNSLAERMKLDPLEIEDDESVE